ncbi:glycoside hydrolase family 36 protein [Vallitalea okinawensis]|uniref:glycoside hydrolase family 36 protein n=1 Tax=Vallitalea okinawensis TaxID=2078660 RepID=UPI000CFB3ED7|nr:glycoside hydrolase family 36 protein [Vallitalea okinawensis]
MDFIKKLMNSKSSVEMTEDYDKTTVELSLLWDGSLLKSSITNKGNEVVKLDEVIIMSGEHGLPGDTKLYGEGYNMLSQYKGTLDKEVAITKYTEQGHYKFKQKEDYRTVYNLAVIEKQIDDYILLGFTSCHRFSSEIRFNASAYEIVLDLEGLEIEPGETWELEEFMALEGNDRESLLAIFAEAIGKNHPKLPFEEIPTGWCSWYCYGPHIDEKIIEENLEAIIKHNLDLKYIQIDDGYQPFMGDWLEPNEDFGMDIKGLLKNIKEKGFEAAIWVAPFIAQKESKLFREHPEWFIKDQEGQPLPSDQFTFGGWRLGPWYMLDGTHPGAREFLRETFRVLNEEWGCTYFKLDANIWGAMPEGVHYDKRATKVEAYRRGMEAVIEGAGKDSFILGCNAPMWPSLGVVHGMRISGDIMRKWIVIHTLAEECFYRNWQHNRLWINDPDCIVLENNEVNLVDVAGNETGIKHSATTKEEFTFHRNHILASGGMVLGSDIVELMSEESVELLKRILPPMKEAAKFDDTSFKVGRLPHEEGYVLVCFNWEDDERTLEIDLHGAYDVVEFWLQEEVGKELESLSLTMPAHSGQAFICKK